MKESKIIGDHFPIAEKSVTNGIPSGYSVIDDNLNGWQKGDLILLVSRPSVGKSLFAMNLARNAAKREVPVLYISLEHRSIYVCSRILKIAMDEAEIPYVNSNEPQLQEIDAITKRVAGLPILVNDSYPLSIDELYNLAKESVQLHGTKLIIIDYLQLIYGPEEYRGRRESELEYIVKTLKALARELDIAVIALTQIARSSRPVIEEPTCKDMRECRSLESVADVILFLHREGDTNSIIVAKNKHEDKGYKFTGLKKKGLFIRE